MKWKKEIDWDDYKKHSEEKIKEKISSLRHFINKKLKKKYPYSFYHTLFFMEISQTVYILTTLLKKK